MNKAVSLGEEDNELHLRTGENTNKTNISQKITVTKIIDYPNEDLSLDDS